MLEIRRILHPTDFSAHSGVAFRVAQSLARDYAARLIVLHVVPSEIIYEEGLIVPLPVGRREDERRQLSRMCAESVHADIDSRLLEGKAAEEIRRLAEELSCDLIVMGTHGRTGLGRVLMGSVAEQVVRKAPCPVLTVRDPGRLDEKAKREPA